MNKLNISFNSTLFYSMLITSTILGLLDKCHINHIHQIIGATFYAFINYIIFSTMFNTNIIRKYSTGFYFIYTLDTLIFAFSILSVFYSYFHLNEFTTFITSIWVLTSYIPLNNFITKLSKSI